MGKCRKQQQHSREHFNLLPITIHTHVKGAGVGEKEKERFLYKVMAGTSESWISDSSLGIETKGSCCSTAKVVKSSHLSTLNKIMNASLGLFQTI